jgi:hypothetical protein
MAPWGYDGAPFGHCARPGVGSTSGAWVVCPHPRGEHGVPHTGPIAMASAGLRALSVVMPSLLQGFHGRLLPIDSDVGWVGHQVCPVLAGTLCCLSRDNVVDFCQMMVYYVHPIVSGWG